MKRATTICALLYSLIIVRGVAAQTDFKPAIFHGLTIGKAKVADVKKQLGNPMEQTDDGHGSVYMFYKDIGPVPGKVEISADKRTQLVWYVAVYPDNLSLDAAKELFGRDYRIIRYNFDNCLDIGGEAPIYEDESGPLEFMVYAARGIVLHLERQPDRVEGIDYRSTPLGPKKSQCKGKKGK
jgi:hypothetical protein